MGKKHIQGGKEMNTGIGKDTYVGWEGNAYRVEGSTYTVGRKYIHAPYKHSLLLLVLDNELIPGNK